MKIKSGYAVHNIAGRWMVISVQDGAASFSELFELNREGYMLWRLLEHGCEQNELVDQLMKGFPDIDAVQAQQDVDSFVERLHTLSLLEE